MAVGSPIAPFVVRAAKYPLPWAMQPGVGTAPPESNPVQVTPSSWEYMVASALP